MGSFIEYNVAMCVEYLIHWYVIDAPLGLSHLISVVDVSECLTLNALPQAILLENPELKQLVTRGAIPNWSSRWDFWNR